MNELKECTEKMFEDIKHIDEEGNEYWLARELQIALDYKKWQKFINVIENAKIACEQSNFIIEDHITQVGNMVDIGSKVKKVDIILKTIFPGLGKWYQLVLKRLEK